MKKGAFLSLMLILLSFVMSAFLYPSMPERVATHWNEKGEVDGYMSREAGLYTLPAISLLLLGLFLAIPRIDPLKANIRQFMKYYEGLIVLTTAFLLYIHILTILWNLGYAINMIQMMTPALGILYYYMGILVGKAKRNWFIGIRTPWTLSNDAVWERTHRLGEKLFKIAGAIAVLGVLLPEHALFMVLIPVLTVSIYLILYSYVEYGKLSK